MFQVMLAASHPRKNISWGVGGLLKNLKYKHSLNNTS